MLKKAQVVFAGVLAFLIAKSTLADAASFERLPGYEAFALQQVLNTWTPGQRYSLGQLVNVTATLVLSGNSAYVALDDTNKKPAAKIVYSVAPDGALTPVATLPSGAQIKVPGRHVAALQAVFMFRNANPPPQTVNFLSQYGAQVVVSTQNNGKVYGIGFLENPAAPPSGLVWIDAGTNEQYHVTPSTFAVTRLHEFP